MHEAGRFARLVEQLAACSSSVGANIAEADEAMSVKDFRKCLGIVSKELAETRYWLELFVRRGWVSERRLVPLVQELVEIKLIVGAMLNRTRDKARAERERSPGS
jgi:four helix bundle protein